MEYNWFERHPRITIIVLLMVGFLVLDVVAANVYKWIAGYPWTERVESRGSTDERIFKVRSEICNQDFIKYASVDNVDWGPLRYRIRINSLGFRDRSIREVPLISENHRILFMGDSFTEGIGVNYEQSFVGIVDESLAQKGIEVLNASVVGYSPTIYWKKTAYLIEEIGLDFNEMVVFLDISDAKDEIVLRSVYDSAASLFLLDIPRDTTVAPKNLPTIFRDLLQHHTIFLFTVLRGIHYQFVHITRQEPLAVDHQFSRWTVDEDGYKEYGQVGVEMMDSSMDSLYSLLRKHNITLSVAVFPWPCQVYCHDLNSIHVKHWREWCQSRNVQFLDYFPYYVKGKTRKERRQVINQYYIHDDIHFNENGHQLVADIFWISMTANELAVNSAV